MRWMCVGRNLSFVVLLLTVGLFTQKRAEANQWGNCADVQGAYCASISLSHCGPYSYDPGPDTFANIAAGYMNAYGLGTSGSLYYYYREGDFTDPAYYSAWYLIETC